MLSSCFQANEHEKNTHALVFQKTEIHIHCSKYALLAYFGGSQHLSSWMYDPLNNKKIVPGTEY